MAAMILHGKAATDDGPEIRDLVEWCQRNGVRVVRAK
jgi:hypothetical protein